MKTILHQIVTRDKISLDGVLFEPERRGKTAIIFIHGLTSSFHGNIKRLTTLAEFATRARLALAAFDNRGHDIISSTHKIDRRKKSGYTYKNIGAGQEDFKESVFDIGAVISFLRKKGYRKIFLAGHSTGAHKAVYYMAKTGRPKVTGVALFGPLSDVPGFVDHFKRRLTKVLREAEAKVRKGQGGQFLPQGLYFHPITWGRLLSLAKPGSSEDVFQYHLKHPNFRTFSSITKPITVIFGEEDQYATPFSVSEIAETLKKYTHSKSFSAKIIPGADHSFIGKEKQLARALLNWIKAVSSS